MCVYIYVTYMIIIISVSYFSVIKEKRLKRGDLPCASFLSSVRRQVYDYLLANHGCGLLRKAVAASTRALIINFTAGLNTGHRRNSETNRRYFVRAPLFSPSAHKPQIEKKKKQSPNDVCIRRDAAAHRLSACKYKSSQLVYKYLTYL